MSDDLDKLLYSALHGLLPLKRRESLLRRYGGWMVIIPTGVYAFFFLIFLALLADFIKFHFGQWASIGATAIVALVGVYCAKRFYHYRQQRVLPRVMSYLERQGIRPHLCLKCQCDLRDTTTEYCSECRVAIAPVTDDAEEGDLSPRL